MADSDEAKKGFRPEDDAWLKSQYEKDQPPPPEPDPIRQRLDSLAEYPEERDNYIRTVSGDAEAERLFAAGEISQDEKIELLMQASFPDSSTSGAPDYRLVKAEEEARRRYGLPVYQEPGTKQPAPRVDKEVGDRRLTRQEQQEALEGMDLSEYEE